MRQTMLIMCQGIQISKTLASIMFHSPRECIIIRPLYNINKRIHSDIAIAIENMTKYIDDNRSFFPNLLRLWQIKADIFNPMSVIDSLEEVLQIPSFSELRIIVDLSGGATPTNIGLYLFAIKHKIPEITFCFPGERFLKTMKEDEVNLIQKQVEFAIKYRYDIPLIQGSIYEINEELLSLVVLADNQKITNLNELKERMEQNAYSLNEMNLSHEYNSLATLGLVNNRKIGKNNEITLTPAGRQYIKYLDYEFEPLELIWSSREVD